MSDQSSQPERPTSDEAIFQEPNDREPTPERQAELCAAYEANVAAGRAPYARVEIRMLGELRWVVRARGWSGEPDAGGKGQRRPDLREATLARGNLSGTHLVGADLSRANLYKANLSKADLRGANLREAALPSADLREAVLADANLREADLKGATLSGAALGGADLSGAVLDRADLSGADLREANLTGADLRRVRMDVGTDLSGATLDSGTRLADALWNGVPLTRIDWEQVWVLGDEQVAREPKDDEGKQKDRARRLRDYTDAVLANRQVATVLRSQGLNEHADRFAFRAQLLQRQVLWRQGQLGRALGSWLLDAVAGYGYKPMRSVVAYVLIICLFAGAYLLNAQFAAPHLTWDEALVLSISSFHGRGFFTTGISLGDTLARLAAGEAIVGLLIEITFIATFTQRFFSR